MPSSLPIDNGAEVRPVEDQNAQYIHNEIDAGHEANTQRLIHWLNAGRRLLKVKAELTARTGTRPIGWKKWLEWAKLSQPTADRYVRYAKYVDDVFGKATFPKVDELEQAWDRTRYAPKVDEPDPPPAPVPAPPVVLEPPTPPPVVPPFIYTPSPEPVQVLLPSPPPPPPIEVAVPEPLPPLEPAPTPWANHPPPVHIPSNRYEASDLWRKNMDVYAHFEAYVMKKFGQLPNKEVDWAAMVVSEHWDNEVTLGQIQTLRAHINAMKLLEESMFASLSSRDQIRLKRSWREEDVDVG